MHAAADHYREIACRADGVDLFLVKRVAGAVVAAHGGFGLGGGDVQRAGADVVDAACRQFVDELDQAFGFRGQADDGVLAEQRAGFARFHIGLADMHAVHFDALVASLPDHVHAVVDYERHRVGLIVVLDDLRDVACGFGKFLGVHLLGTQLDEGGAATQGVVHHVGDRSALAILRAYDEVGAQIETVAHGCVWEIIAHWCPLIA